MFIVCICIELTQQHLIPTTYLRSFSFHGSEHVLYNLPQPSGNMRTLTYTHTRHTHAHTHTIFITRSHMHTLLTHTHQLKNMTCFKVDQWKEEEQGNLVLILAHSVGQLLKDMYIGRIKSGHCSRVPKLKESFICRDSAI